jgi:hypothetical protein
MRFGIDTSISKEPATSIFWHKMEKIGSHETLVPTYQTALCLIPEGTDLYSHCGENLKCHKLISAA